ncbi:MAG: hypothetical protein DCC88_06040 [Spirobacillus cienkowskii]|jgi:peptidoglycan-associated lipoprotein|uniref:Peptidoglycan-associated lipoprotein n=2 Tax=Spirobacillus cienkowskii TaxID=495820 RepID=A0A369KU56_9BACT|nr:MAG: hypothetical protein DCC88_06040 [Spirobacillus cienkowskii]
MELPMKISKIIACSSIISLAVIASSCSSTNTASGTKPATSGSESTAKVATQTPDSSLILKTIYFDFNKYVIREDQKDSAMQIAEKLKSSSSLEIQIQGNTDDRGSTEYNIALGQKRAQALKNFLISNGVQNNIETISFGKERPAVKGNNEDAWAKNRRDDIVKLK